MAVHPWQNIPCAKKSAREMKSALEHWLENPYSRGPRPFRWRAWYAAARKEWTGDATALMGQQILTPHLGAVLWSRIQAPPERFPQPDHPEYFARQMIASRAEALRAGRRGLHNACTPNARAAYLARMPDNIRVHLEEICREEAQVNPWVWPDHPQTPVPPPSHPSVLPPLYQIMGVS